MKRLALSSLGLGDGNPGRRVAEADRRVSLPDATIAAFAIRGGAVLMHKDPELDALLGLLPMEALPCKSSDGGL